MIHFRESHNQIAENMGLAPLLLVGLTSAFAFTPNVLKQPLSTTHSLHTLKLQQRATSPRLASAATSLEAAAAPPPAGVGVTPSIINLAKNIVGSGVLALAAGIAAFSGSSLGLLPALIILFSTGIVSAYTFSTIARIGAGVGASSYRDTWAKIFGDKTAFIVSCVGVRCMPKLHACQQTTQHNQASARTHARVQQQHAPRRPASITSRATICACDTCVCSLSGPWSS